MRELEGRVLLGLAAAERGHNVVVGRKREILDCARGRTFPPGIVHMKSIQGSMLPKMARIQRMGHLLSTQDEESGLLYDTYEHFAKLRHTNRTLDLVEKVFCWGEFDRHELERFFPQHGHKFVATGSPRVDFWRSGMAQFYRGEARSPAQRPRPFILVASNFLFAHSPRSRRDLVRQAERHQAGVPYGEWTREKFLDVVNYDIELRDLFTLFLKSLARTIPEIDIIVRPHPAEDFSGWQRQLSGYPNLLVIHEGSISEWIHAARAVIHNGCTSGLEAAAGGIPVFAYRPIRSDFDREFPNRISQEFSSAAALTAAIRELAEGKPSAAEQPIPAELKRRLGNLEGPLAADRIVAELEAVADPEMAETAPFALRREAPLWRLVIAAQETRKRLRGLAGGRVSIKDSQFPALEQDEVMHIRNRLTATLGRFENIEVAPLNDFMCCLRRPG